MSDEQDNKMLEELRSVIHRELEDELSQVLFSADEQGVADEVRQRIEKQLLPDVLSDFRRRAFAIRRRVEQEHAARRKREAKVPVEKKEAEETFTRFTLNMRIQHMVLFTSVLILIFTGLPLRFHEWSVSAIIIRLLGGIRNSTILHRVGAGGLIVVSGYHVLYTVFSRQGRRDFWLLLPRPKDMFDAIKMFKHFLGFSEETPKFGRFSYIEKFDYWAVYWGCVIMIGSGLLLWFQDIALMALPKFILDIAKEAHSDEALLATLAIVVWHFYNVHFNPERFPGSLMWWHGRITLEEMLKEHPLEYEEMLRAREKQVAKTAKKMGTVPKEQAEIERVI